MFRCTSSEIPCLARFPTLRRGFLAGQGISSLPTVIHCAGLAVGGSPIPFRDFKISILTVPSSSSQATYRLRRAFSFHCEAHHALILLLLASNRDPLCWARGWVPPLRGGFVSRQGLHLFYQHMTDPLWSLLQRGSVLFVSAQVRRTQLSFLKIAHYRANCPTLSTNLGFFSRPSIS